jgi:hypothetical protein
MLQTLHWLLEATQFKVNEFQLQPWWILAPSIASLAAFVGAVAAKYISTLS